MTLHLRQLAPLAAMAVLMVAGCGDSGLSENEKIPADVSQALLAEIEDINNRVQAGVGGACDDIFENKPGGNFQAVDGELARVPDDVDRDVRSTLEQSVDRLRQLVDEECTEIQASEDQETTPDVEPVEPVPEETETVPTETETTPTETETTPEEPTDPGGGKGPNGEGPPGQDGTGGGLELPEGGEE